MNKVTIRRFRSACIVLFDIFGIYLIFPIVYYFRLDKFPSIFSFELFLILTAILSTMFLMGTYFLKQSASSPRIPISTFFIALLAIFPSVILVYILGPENFNQYFGRGVLPFGMIIFGIWATIVRFLINRFYYWSENNSELLYLGYSGNTNQFLQELKNNSEIRKIVVTTANELDRMSSPIPELTEFNTDIQACIKQRHWTAVILDPHFVTDDAINYELVKLRLNGTAICSLSDYYEHYWYKLPVHQIEDEWLLNTGGFSIFSNPFSLRLKRFFDIVIAVVLSPLVLIGIFVAGIVIMFASKGPVFFKQRRVGLNGRPFTIYKLRTMHIDAEKEGAKWAEKNDPRIIPVGNFLRKSRIDELPQFWNVLKGDMSFIGPRPEQEEFTASLSKKIPYYDLRHLIKPGLSGWAQVMYNYGSDENDALKKLEYELYYIKNQSLLLDLNIVLRTIMVMFKQQGR